MIHSIDIHNFKSILKQRIQLDRLTLFVGANGSGKSSVLEAVSLAIHPEWTLDQAEEVYGSRSDWLYTRNGSGDLRIVCNTDRGSINFAMDPLESIESPDLSLRFDDYSMVHLRLDAMQVAKPSYSEHQRPDLAPDGGGTASVLALMALNDPDAFADLMNHVRTFLPRFQRIRFRRVPIERTETERISIGLDTGERRSKRTVLGEGMLFDFEGAPSIVARAVSEGSLMILGLLTAILGPDRPEILLLDDLESGLHPLAQRQLVAFLRQILERFPNLQILATSHSPHLLNELEPEQVRIMTTDEKGHALCGRLTDHPKFSTWKDEMAPGEMWSLLGESWLKGVETPR